MPEADSQLEVATYSCCARERNVSEAPEMIQLQSTNRNGEKLFLKMLTPPHLFSSKDTVSATCPPSTSRYPAGCLLVGLGSREVREGWSDILFDSIGVGYQLVTVWSDQGENWFTSEEGLWKNISPWLVIDSVLSRIGVHVKSHPVVLPWARSHISL